MAVAALAGQQEDERLRASYRKYRQQALELLHA
jgi:hypothetical protein